MAMYLIAEGEDVIFPLHHSLTYVVLREHNATILFLLLQYI